MDKSRQNRKISIELLRIVAMFLIILCHVAGGTSNLTLHGFAPGTVQPYRGFSATVWNMLWQYGQVGVQIFFIITGYFLCKKAFSLPRVVKAWAQVFLYSVLIGGIVLGAYLLFGFPRSTNLLLAHDAVIKNVTEIFAPILSYHYWFMTTYILVLLLAPAVNSLARRWGGGWASPRTVAARILECCHARIPGV